jgi:hypothetical protein
MIIYIIFFVFIVMLEFSPIFIKSNMDATDYDLWKVNDELAKRRTMEMEAARVKRIQDRMNKYIPGYVRQVKGEWNVHTNGKVFPYIEGMTIQ